MIFKIYQDPSIPASGVTVELKRARGKKEDWLQSGGRGTVYKYAWTMNAFTGQHGEPFGEIWAEDIDKAYEDCRAITTGILRRKRSYEEAHERASLPPIGPMARR